MWNIPISEARLTELLPLFGGPGTAIDLGCGTGGWIHRLESAGWSGWGIDTDADAIDAANKGPGRFEVGDANTAPEALADLSCCLGSTHAFGSGPDALIGAARFMRPRTGRWALFGEGFHTPPIPAPYAEILGAPSGIERTHAENVDAIESEGFDVIHAITATTAEWDAFEWAFYRRKGKQTWRDAYLKWGRRTMGFGVYVARPT